MSISSSLLRTAYTSISRLFADTNLTTSIQYKKFCGSSFSEELGYTEEIFLSSNLVAIKVERKRFSIASLGEMGAIAGVEVNFLVQDLPEGYSNRDLIQHEGVNHQIEKISKIAELAYKIEIQGV